MWGARQWVAIVAGVPVAIWLYGTIVSIGRVYLPPTDPPSIDFSLPFEGAARPADAQFGMEVEIRSDSCDNPVRVFVQALGPEARRARNWLRSDARLTVGVLGDQPVRGLRAFIGEQVDYSHFFDPNYHGGAGVLPISTRPVSHAPSAYADGAWGITGRPTAFPSSGSDPTVSWSFDADWLRPRTYGTCYLQIPGINGSFGVLETGGFLPPDGHEAVWVQDAAIGVTSPLRVIANDSDPPPERPEDDAFWTCGPHSRLRQSHSCGYGYVALAAPGALDSSPSSAQVPYVVALGVVAGLIGEAFLRFRLPRRRSFGSGSARSQGQRSRPRTRD